MPTLETWLTHVMQFTVGASIALAIKSDLDHYTMNTSSSSSSRRSSSSTRRVRLSNHVQVHALERSGSFEEAEADLFYTRQEVQAFRSNFQACVQQLEQQQQDKEKLMKQPLYLGRDNNSDDDNDNDDSNDDVTSFYAKHAAEGWGLEHAALRRQAAAAQHEELLDRILDIQESIIHTNNKEEAIRAVSEQITKSAKRFAQKIAQVGAQAA